MPAPRLSDRIEDALPILNLLVLLIPVVATAMQLSSAAADLVTRSASPADVAELETPALRERAPVELPADEPRAPPIVEPARPSEPPGPPEPVRPAASGFHASPLGYGL